MRVWFWSTATCSKSELASSLSLIQYGSQSSTVSVISSSEFNLPHFIFIFLGPSLNHLYMYIHIQCIWLAVYLNYSPCNLRHKSSSKIINAITSRSCGYSGSQSSWHFSTLHYIAREEQQASLKALRLPMVNWVFLNHVVSRRFANNNVVCSQGQKTTLD